jgi:hypothetical protein
MTSPDRPISDEYIDLLDLDDDAAADAASNAAWAENTKGRPLPLETDDEVEELRDASQS